MHQLREHHQNDDEEFASVITFDPIEVLRRVRSESGDKSDLTEAAVLVAGWTAS